MLSRKTRIHPLISTIAVSRLFIKSRENITKRQELYFTSNPIFYKNTPILLFNIIPAKRRKGLVYLSSNTSTTLTIRSLKANKIIETINANQIKHIRNIMGISITATLNLDDQISETFFFEVSNSDYSGSINNPIMIEDDDEDDEMTVRVNYKNIKQEEYYKETKDNNTNNSEKINQLDKETWKKENEICSICLDQIKERALISTCNHGFCYLCVSKWAKLCTECPICNTHFNIITYISRNNRKIKWKFPTKRFKYTRDRNEIENDKWIIDADDNCMICKRGKNREELWICDGCNKNVCHTSCVNLDKIPDGEWFCPICKDL